MNQPETRLEKRTRMFDLIKTYLSRDQTQKDFCLDKGINYSTFQFWLRRYRQNNENPEIREEHLTSGEFVPIKLSPSSEYPNRSDFGFQIEYPNGIRILMEYVPDIGLIKELLNLQAA